MNTRYIKILSLGCAAAFGPLSQAAVTVGARDNVQIGGFFSQGYVKSDQNNYPMTAKDGTDEFREMAVNATTTVGAHFRLGAQVFAQRFGPYGDDKVLLDWAVADYNFSQAFGVRVGRVKLPKSLYSDVIDLDVVRPFVFLPSSLYSPILRDFSSSFDGAMVYGNLAVGQGSFDYKVFYGDIPMKPDQGAADFFNQTSVFKFPAGVTKLGMDYVTGSSLYYTTPIAGLRFGVSYMYFRHIQGAGTFAHAPVPITTIGDRYEYKTVSAEYITGSWTFAAEFQRNTDVFRSLTPISPPMVTPSAVDGWYVSVARRLNRSFEVGTYYSFQKSPTVASTLPKARRQSSDIAISLRYDVSDHLLFKIEGNYFDGQMGMINTPRMPNPLASRKDTTTFWSAKTTLSF